MNDLQNKRVFVTGSARRVGRAIALAFAEQGANLVIHHASASSAGEAQKVADEVRAMGREAFVISGDQGVYADVVSMTEQIEERYGSVDVMVNSAAIFKRTPMLDISEAEWDSVMAVNLKGPFFLTQHIARLMKSNGGGVIINISDNSGLNPWASRPHHSISKAGVIMLTQVAALALAPYGIRVNCVVPGPVLVPADAEESVLSEIESALPLGHIGNPANIADACIFFAKNTFATGAILRVDGGEGLAHGET
ncbi:MAG: SDR family NAD(P)-dependent oxidoreductase [Phototrophicaceae bacterium]